MSSIQCETIKEFIEITAGLVREGVIFEAYSSNLLIKLTGGF